MKLAVKTKKANEMARAKTVRRLVFSRLCLGLIIVLLTGTVSQADCVQDTLARVDGAIIVVVSGAVYRVFNANGIDLSFWLPPAGVTICDQVNISGESYYAISNEDANQTVFAVRQR